MGVLNRKISIIIPVYKVEKYLARCLDSVLGQTYRELEVICVDDGSPDNSGAILAAYALQDARVKVLTQENKGQSAARNAGLDIATGAWIMFVDSDDWIPADAVASFVQVAEASGAPIVASATYAIDKFNATLPRTLHWSLKTPALKHLVGKRKMQSSPWNKLFRADILKNRRFIDGIYFEDWVYITEAFGDVESFAKIKEPMYVYCLNGGDVSTIRSPFILHKAHSYRTAIAHARDYFKDHPMKKWGLKRADIAQRMLEKRLRRMVGVKSVSIRGGLGNQMFQYAFGKALEKLTGDKVLFDLSWFVRSKKTIVNEKGEKSNGCLIRDYGLDAFPNVRMDFCAEDQEKIYYEKSWVPKFLRKLFRIPRFPNQVDEKDACLPDGSPRKHETDRLYVGYYAGEKFFRAAADEVRRDFAFPPLKDPSLETLRARIRSAENAVSIHLRRGDYVKLGWALKLDYYRAAVRHVVEHVKNPTFFVFSDADADWVRDNLKLNHPFEIVGNKNDMMDDLQLMASCDHLIIANSTFSWWAAWLSPCKTGKIITAPTPWFPKSNDVSIIPERWTKITHRWRDEGGFDVSKPKVSVLLPVYKTNPSVLREAIESVLAQTRGDFELLILDDCPQNMREKVVRSYDDPRIKYACNEKNLGIAGTRNKLMQMARGDYFAVIDHDDIWLPTKLEKQVAFMESHPDVVACGTAYRRHKCIFRKRLVRHEEEHDDIYARLFFRCTMYHGSVLLRASTVRAHNLNYNRVYVSLNDRVLYLRLGRHGKLHNLREPLCLYRFHGHMVSAIYREAILKEHRQVRRALLDVIGLKLDAEEFEIFNDYVMRGKRLPSTAMIARVHDLLARCVAANNKTGAFPREAFRHMCAMYRMKRSRKLAFKLHLTRLFQRGHL